MSAAVLAFPTPPARFAPAPEADLAERLFCRLSDRRFSDRIVCTPAALTRVAAPARPMILIFLDGDDFMISADAARRLALIVQAAPLRREGAAHDLIGAADLAESLTFNLHRSR